MAETSIKARQYLCNPEVILREESASGGLLFNPDTNQVKIVNSSGLFIWKQFARVNRADVVTEAISNHFEEVPADVVQTDLKEFLDEMIQTGFIGLVETE